MASMENKVALVQRLLNNLPIDWDEVQSFKLVWEEKKVGDYSAPDIEVYPNIEIEFKDE